MNRTDHEAERRACAKYMARDPMREVRDVVGGSVLFIIHHPLKTLGWAMFTFLIWLASCLWLVS